MQNFQLGRLAGDMMVGVHPFAPFLDKVGEISDSSGEVLPVVKDPAGNHYARRAGCGLTRVYPAGQQGATS